MNKIAPHDIEFDVESWEAEPILQLLSGTEFQDMFRYLENFIYDYIVSETITLFERQTLHYYSQKGFKLSEKWAVIDNSDA